MKRPWIAVSCLVLLPFACRGATVPPDAAKEGTYIPVDDPLVAAKLAQWRDLKFGLLMHWGPYSQWGVVESWSLCGEDEPWCRRKGDDYEAYRREYEALQTTFDPVGFDPSRWARAARVAGMRYVIFTTKHHDGFCMFDTQLTDYKITDPACPFHDDPRADVTAEIFDAFRAEGLWTGAYFSKPDWHSPDYWWPYFPVHDRNPNYELTRYPERWERFVEYTHGQIEELMTNYGKIDILWLDGGWVQPQTEAALAAMRADPAFRFRRPQSQDIRMDELAAMARRHQPGLIVVDRAVRGPNQNYLTPENRVPERALPYPWESCITSGGGWSFTPDAEYMGVREAVHLLVDIVAKGGNLLLNVAPGPDGRWQDGAYELLAGIGEWMDVNGAAIYGSRPRPPHKRGDVCVVDGADGVVYALVLAAAGEEAPSGEVVVPGAASLGEVRVRMLGDGRELPWRARGEDLLVRIPSPLRAALPCAHAWTLVLEGRAGSSSGSSARAGIAARGF